MPNEHLQTLYRNALTRTPLREYLERYYKNEGGAVEFEYLEGAQFILEECLDCGLIFQKEVPSDWMIRRIWEHWIDPAGARDRFATNVVFDSYAAYSAARVRFHQYRAGLRTHRRAARHADDAGGSAEARGPDQDQRPRCP